LWMGSTDRHLLLREAEDAIVIVHLEKMQATRFASPYFKDLHLADCIPPDDTFLFLDLQNPLPRWRAELSAEKSAFTACFYLSEFVEQKDDWPADVYLSSERATDYYALIRDFEDLKQGRVVRKRMGNRSPVSASIKIRNKAQPEMKRLSWHPDKFIIGGQGEMDVCAKNLTSDYKIDMPPRDVWAIDLINGHLYYFDRAILKRTDLAFEHTERFLKSHCCFFFNEHHQRLGLCPATSTLMLGIGPKAALYEFTSNRISSPFSWGRVIGTKPAQKWYSYDYCKETRALTLRDVTGELSSLLQWEEAAVSPHSDEMDPDWDIKLHQQIYFGFKGTEEPEDGNGVV
jgi:hypothetical protein